MNINEAIDLESTFFSHFLNLSDPRTNINIKHKLTDILVITLCAVLCNCDGWEEIEQFGKARFDWFNKFLHLPYGIPSHDRIRAVFINLDPNEFEEAFRNWVVEKAPKGLEWKILAIDGKTNCGSHDRANGKKAIHMVSAWLLENKLVMGQVKTEEKSNEITAIPQLIKALDLKNCILTADAMACQKQIVKTIVEKDADYILAVKNNQPGMFDKIKKAFDVGNDDVRIISKIEEEDKRQHGRDERREYYLTTAPGYMNQTYTWEKLKTVGKVVCERLINGKLSTETRYFISSLEKSNFEKYCYGVRGHWGIENSLHWQLDVSFSEDQCRKRAKNAAQNFSLIRKISLNILKADKSKKIGIKSKRKLAGWDNKYLEKLLFS
jgi:predicted transposase YbfD/YdcC